MTKVFDLTKLAAFSKKKGTLKIPDDLLDVKKDLLTSKNFTVAGVS